MSMGKYLGKELLMILMQCFELGIIKAIKAKRRKEGNEDEQEDQ